jgi:hypothetical protein
MLITSSTEKGARGYPKMPKTNIVRVWLATQLHKAACDKYQMNASKQEFAVPKGIKEAWDSA